MDCLVRFAQTLESFRKAEIEALATLIGINVEFLAYAEDVGDDLRLFT
jgi:tRNA (guanine10-N2)-methyltransferase